ncbi:MAG: hypothetical protein HYZ15_04845 [Sphingobacteriales bacterium]|nr:hypothetical protein [Sphingobacteriales bacterium]
MSKKYSATHRVVLYCKDISLITGRKYRAARNLYLAILKAFDKQPRQFVTLQEFSLYTGIQEELILKYLNS